MLRRRCLDIVGLARRAGHTVSGYEKVRSALKAGDGAVILAASDAAEDGASKVQALAPKLPVVTALTGDELGAAFGRDRTVHAVMTKGRLAERFLVEAARLNGLTESKSNR